MCVTSKPGHLIVKARPTNSLPPTNDFHWHGTEPLTTHNDDEHELCKAVGDKPVLF